MTTATIRKKLHDYINTADDIKVEAIYIMVEGDLTERADIWEDEKFLNELDRRVEELKAGKIKGISPDELKSYKLDTMKLAVSDPLFLADLAEIKDDFAAIDNHDI